MNMRQRFLKDQSGAVAMEYGTIGALISVLIVGAVTSVSIEVQAMMANIAAHMS
ncbi:MAG: Flp family type IVb pilin [Alphaproteobacteria bacterium]|nr:Flp family type IVb pilin [Alphaproteobacteria bacterium]